MIESNEEEECVSASNTKQENLIKGVMKLGEKDCLDTGPFL